MAILQVLLTIYCNTACADAKLTQGAQGSHIGTYSLGSHIGTVRGKKECLKAKLKETSATRLNL